jgi:hypothetical protein
MTTNGFNLMDEYVVGAAGEQLTEVQRGQWSHTNVYAGGS